MSAMESYDNVTPFNKLNKKERRELRRQGNLELKYITPKTENQRKAFNYYDDEYNLSLLGYPGTGKSFISLYLALNEIEKNNFNSPKSVTVVRSIVPSRDVGFLPGSAKEKAKVYEAPYIDICNQLYGRGDAYDILQKKGTIHFETTSYLRSITMNDTIIIVDECQNLSDQELHTIITRVGENSRIIFAGDTGQNDLVYKKNDVSGLPFFLKIIEKIKSFKIVKFDANDIVRSGLVKEYIIIRENMKFT
jgi:predicted ribonuclease YlaK